MGPGSKPRLVAWKRLPCRPVARRGQWWGTVENLPKRLPRHARNPRSAAAAAVGQAFSLPKRLPRRWGTVENLRRFFIPLGGAPRHDDRPSACRSLWSSPPGVRSARTGVRTAFLVCLCLRACAAWWIMPSRAAPEQISEYDVKAAFLMNFAKFVEWPSTAFASSGSPIAICILGKDPFGRAMDDVVEGETVNGRKVTVQRMTDPPAPKTCQMVFAAGAGKETAKALSGLGRGVLTVGEGENFVRDGGIIGFVIENRRVRFDINQPAAVAAGLTLSSKLLSVARAVEK